MYLHQYHIQKVGYYLNAFIGKSKDLTCICDQYSKATLVNLGQDVSLIPLTEDLYEQINELDAADGVCNFEYLTRSIESAILRTIEMKSLAYVEVLYHGGTGGQAAIIWKDGIRDRQIYFGQGAVNAVLREFGVIADANRDEFDTLGFGRHRDTERWAASGADSSDA